MDQIIAQIQAFAVAHPWYFAGLTYVFGFYSRSFFTKENARKLVKWYFTWQRAKLKKAGKSDAEIAELMASEAELLTAASQEAKTEADAASLPPTPPPA